MDESESKFLEFDESHKKMEDLALRQEEDETA